LKDDAVALGERVLIGKSESAGAADCAASRATDQEDIHECGVTYRNSRGIRAVSAQVIGVESKGEIAVNEPREAFGRMYPVAIAEIENQTQDVGPRQHRGGDRPKHSIAEGIEYNP